MENLAETALTGFGLGLRPQHYQEILRAENLAIDWLEILSENYFVAGGQPLYYLDQVAERFPLVMHGVSMSLGSTDPLDYAYLAQLKALATRISAKIVSDHLCWTGVASKNSHDLLPLPLTVEALDHVVARVKMVQDFLERPLAIENPSSYLAFAADVLTEWDFLRELVEQTGCQLLLDVNNVYVSSHNHGFCPKQYISSLPTSSIVQLHLAGHSRGSHCLIDTHDATVPSEVLGLYQFTLQTHGFRPTMIERDGNIPSLAELLLELEMVRGLDTSHSRLREPVGRSNL